MLGQSHRPTDDRAASLCRHFADLNDPIASDATLYFYLSPFGGLYMVAKLLKTAGVLANEIPVQYCAGRTILGFEHGFDYSLQQSYIAVDADLNEAIRKTSPGAQQVHRLLGMFESQQPHFWQRVDVDYGRSVSLRGEERGKHPRMICSWILPD